ncbi:protein of unknown function [Marinobacter mobilis]|uniref:DUF4124 domain-containing protein n=2 Tax=Marinobacter mobilis TaxID=488533 RepID=A0A1H3B6E8_9GAMM|nr:protein of unknown function [Marinobacter mobilis]
MKSRSLFFALAVTMAPGLAVSESVYKWTDENGITHYGDRQPTGRNAESVNIRTGSASGNSQTASPQAQLGELEEAQQARAEAQQMTAQEQARQRQMEANCETARTNLSVMNTSSRVKIEENGETRYLSPEEIAEKKAYFSQIATENCNESSAEK